MPTTLMLELDTARDETQHFRGKSTDRFALVQDAFMVSDWSTYEQAVQEGYRIFGMEPFRVMAFRGVDPDLMSREER